MAKRKALTPRAPIWLTALTMFAAVHPSTVEAEEAPQRLVSLSGDITEIIYACGAGDRLVGVDSTSLYPPEATTLPQVGYVRNLNAEGVLSLAPDLVLGTSEAGPPEVVAQLRGAGVEMHLIPEHNDVDGVRQKVRAVAESLDADNCAQRLLEDIDEGLARTAEHIAEVRERRRPSVLFILNITAGGPPLAGGRDTGADTIIQLAGGRNAAADFNGYKPMAPEALVQVAPDVIVMFDDRLDALGGPEGLARMPGLALTPAVQIGRVYGMNGLLLLGFGPRVGEAAWQLAHLLYPGDASAD